MERRTFLTLRGTAAAGFMFDPGRKGGRLAAARILLCTLTLGSLANAQPQPDQECAQLLGSDAAFASLRDAAVRNLAADALKAPATQRVRRTTEAVLDALSDGSGNAAERICVSLAVERVNTAALLTGYYRPLVPARRAREDAFSHPLYALPEPALRGRSRAEIDKGALAGKVPVVAWLADPVEAFFIHIQGSALLALPDGQMAVGYAGSNERSYTSIGTLLVKDGRMRREDVTMASLKAYLRDHPSERDAVLHANERYIYFKPVDSRPTGSLGVPLTDGRSLAADPDVYPPGTLLFVRSASGSGGVTSRLAFVQDRGSAITGPGRLDLFVGTGDDAGTIAGALRQDVEIFVLHRK